MLRINKERKRVSNECGMRSKLRPPTSLITHTSLSFSNLPFLLLLFTVNKKIGFDLDDLLLPPATAEFPTLHMIIEKMVRKSARATPESTAERA